MNTSTIGQEHSTAPIDDAGIDGATPKLVLEAMREHGMLPPEIMEVRDIRVIFGVRLTYAEFHVVVEAIREAYRSGRFRPDDYHFPEEAALAGICREWLAMRQRENP